MFLSREELQMSIRGAEDKEIERQVCADLICYFFVFLYGSIMAVVIASEDHSPEKGHNSFSNLLLF